MKEHLMSKKIYLADLSHQTKQGRGSDMMPLQIGLIGAYCKQEHGEEIEIELFRDVEEFSNAVLKEPPFIIGASNYMWNLDITYKYLSAIKQQYPEIITIMGGPNYPDIRSEQIQWLEEHPNVDCYVYKDGEIPFSEIVGHLLKEPDLIAFKQAKLASCHTFHNGESLIGEMGPRLLDLSLAPSPYTMGLMDKFFEETLLPAMQTNRGCPFSCAFCTEGGDYYNKVSKHSLQRKKEEFDYIASHIKHTKTLRLTDSNFGMFKEDVEFSKYLGEIRRSTGFPEYVLCTTGKNRKERVLECNENLGGILRITASVQSLDKEVLANVKRSNISIEDLTHFSDQTSDTDAESYSELILGLPGDSRSAEENGFKGLMDTGISLITQHQFALIHGSELNTKTNRDKFEMVTKFRPQMRCAGTYKFGKQEFLAIEVEEICVANKTMSESDYLDMRLLFFTVGIFYNDRIFAEIHALLRILDISTFDWIKFIFDHKNQLTPEIGKLYEDFAAETMGELFSTQEEMVSGVTKNIDRYLSGEIGSNINYKYRAVAAIQHFDALAENAYSMLRALLNERGIRISDYIDDLERFSRNQKSKLRDLEMETEETFSFDIVRLITDVKYSREGGSLEGLHRPTTIHFAHSPEQREMIKRQLNMYGDSDAGLAMIYARFAVKHFYRKAQVCSPALN
jgi:hypothetical protein